MATSTGTLALPSLEHLKKVNTEPSGLATDLALPAIMQPIRSERHMKIACIGAGASGLCFAYKLQRSFEHFTLTIFEKNAGIGGVWLENRYPGYVLTQSHG